MGYCVCAIVSFGISFTVNDLVAWMRPEGLREGEREVIDLLKDALGDGRSTYCDDTIYTTDSRGRSSEREVPMLREMEERAMGIVEPFGVRAYMYESGGLSGLLALKLNPADKRLGTVTTDVWGYSRCFSCLDAAPLPEPDDLDKMRRAVTALNEAGLPGNLEILIFTHGG